MKKYAVIFLAVFASIFAAWFAYHKYVIFQAEKEYLAYVSKPRAQIFFWNQSGVDANGELRYKDGQLAYFHVSGTGATSAEYPAGDLSIFVTFTDGAKTSFENLTLNNGVKVSFEILKDSIQPRNP